MADDQLTPLAPTEDPTLPTTPPVQQGQAPQPPAMPAVPAAPAAPAAEAAPQGPAPLPQGPQEMATFQDTFKDPAMLQRMAITFMKHGDDTGLQWLHAAHAAAHENLYEALGHLQVDDGPGAVAAFNKSGRFADATDATKNDNGTWTVQRKSGPPVTFNVDTLARSLLSPAEYLHNKQQTELQGAQQEELKARAGYYNNRNETLGAIAQTRADASRDVQAARNETLEYKARLDSATKQVVAGSKGRVVDPGEQFDKLTESFGKNPIGQERPEDSAMKVVIANPWATQVELNRDGGVDVRSKSDGSVFKQFPSQKAFEDYTGRPLNVPKKAAPAPAAAAPGAPRAPGAPSGPGAGLSNDQQSRIAALSDDQLPVVARSPVPAIAAAAAAEIQRRTSDKAALTQRSSRDAEAGTAAGVPQYPGG